MMLMCFKSTSNIVFSVHKHNFTALQFNNIKTRTTMNVKISLFDISVEAIIFVII